MVTGSVFAAVSFVLRESELHGGLLLTRCELFAASGLEAAFSCRLAIQPRRLTAHLEDFTLRLGCQFRRQRRRSSHLLRRSACPFSVLFLPPRSVAPSLSGSIPTLGTSMVADDLRPCVSADHGHLRALHGAGVDEHDLTRETLTKAETFIDKPLVDSQLHDFGVVSEGFFEAGFALLVVQLRALSFQPLQPSGPPRPS